MRKPIFIAIAIAAGLVLFSGAASSADTLDVHLVSQTNNNITLGWTPQAGYGYLFSTQATASSAFIVTSRTNNANASTVTFAKGSYAYEVAVIVKGNNGHYPPPAVPDTTPPTVSVTAPVNGTTVSGTINETAAANDNIGVTRVEFRRDGNLFATDTTAPYSAAFNTTTVPNGPHTFGALAYDAAGNVGAAADITVTVNNVASVAKVTQTIVNGSTIPNITGWRAVYDANGDGVEDDPGSIRFLIDDVQVLSEVNAPFGDTFATGSPSTSNGQHTFRVDAVNGSNVVVATNTVTATVGSTPPPPAQCADGVDNADPEDTLIDMADPGCTSASDNDETDPVVTTGYPDASNTGVPPGTTLTPITNTTVTTNNAVLNAVSTSGCIDVLAYGVTIKNSRVGCVIIDGGAAGNPANPPLTIQDTEIICPIGDWNTGIRFDNFVAVRVNIHNCENGLDIGTHATLRDSYIHDLAAGASYHNDGIQSADGSYSTIEHNTIYAIDTSAINISNYDAGPHVTNTLIKNNLLAGGTYTLYCPKPSTVNFQILDNHFSTIFHPNVGFYGPSTDCDGEIQSGNVIHETGLPINLD